MKLSTLIQDLPEKRILGDAAVDIRGVKDDSRQVGPGDIFVAIRGLHSDGHEYVDKAIAQGAAAIVAERELESEAARRVAQVIVPKAAHALGVIAAHLAGDPADRLGLIGVTGTNGKTTSTFLAEAVLAASGARPGVIGTVSYRYAGREEPSPYTTPTPLVLHRVFADMVASGCTHTVMEVSSAALMMDRLAAITFQVAAFTNLSQDHLDLHGTMDAYCRAKALLFSHHLAKDGTAVINIDDAAAPIMIEAAGRRRVLRVSSRPDAGAEVSVLSAESSVSGIRATIATPRGEIEVSSHALLGGYNIANIALVVAVGEALGLSQDAICRGIGAMPGVPGRVQRVANDQGLDILVDYAHTPDALQNVLDALRPLTRRRLICVFGCGGDRDPTKRPIMGAAVAEKADLAFVTSDNPRTEEPRAIIDMILAGMTEPFFVDTDRRVAIRAAVAEATPGDIILIAGKGHEDYQILGTQKIHFDDREEAAEAVRLRQRFPLADVVRACEGQLVSAPAQAPNGDIAFTRVVIDSRTAAPGDLYVAIRGERFDGHAFCGSAIEAGSLGVVIDKDADTAGIADLAHKRGAAIIRVHDTREALGAIARWHRRRFSRMPIIGVTGSAGKTTTKELITAALSPAGRVHRARGSLNNETGVPLTLLGLRPYHDMAVIEMGMRGLGQIDYLVGIAEPTVGVVVNAGLAHVGVVGSVEAIARGKAEIFGRLPPDGVAILPADDARLTEHARTAPRRITFGESDAADVHLVAYEPRGLGGADVRFRIRRDLDLGDGSHNREYSVRLPLLGRHNAINAACAVAAAMAAGVSAEAAVAGLARAKTEHMRGELAEIGGRHVLVDCYNANPASMEAALRTLAELGGRVAVLGDMLELGDMAPEAHRQIGALAAELGISVIAVGEHRHDLVNGVPGGLAAETMRDAAALALETTKPGDSLLLKASRGVRLERVLDEMRMATKERQD